MTTTSGPGRALPRLDLLRELTDQSVLDAVFAGGPITRAEVARRTGISKPTINEAVRRLAQVGLLRSAGNQTGRPGRVATFYEVAPEAGFVIAVDLGPAAIRVRACDLLGHAFDDTSLPPPQPPTSAGVADVLRRGVSAARASGEAGHGPLRAVAISVANPVDPATGSVIWLPDTPYPEGRIQPAEVLAGIIDAPLLVDNDVNLAAVAERARGVDVATFAYFFVGAGLGMGLVIDGQLFRGTRGLAGEIGYLPTSDAATGRHALARAVSGRGFGGRGSAGDDPEALAQVIGEAAAAVCALVDPQVVVLGGPIGMEPSLLEPVRRVVAELAPVPVPVVAAACGETAPLQGAVLLALERARADLFVAP